MDIYIFFVPFLSGKRLPQIPTIPICWGVRASPCRRASEHPQGGYHHSLPDECSGTLHPPGAPALLCPQGCHSCHHLPGALFSFSQSPEDVSVTSTHPALPFRPGLHLVHLPLLHAFALPYHRGRRLDLHPSSLHQDSILPALAKDILKAALLLCSALIAALRQLTSPPWLWHPDAAFLCSC